MCVCRKPICMNRVDDFHCPSEPSRRVSSLPGELKQGGNSSLESVQRLPSASSLQGQRAAARTAEVKRLSAPQ